MAYRIARLLPTHPPFQKRFLDPAIFSTLRRHCATMYVWQKSWGVLSKIFKLCRLPAVIDYLMIYETISTQWPRPYIPACDKWTSEERTDRQETESLWQFCAWQCCSGAFSRDGLSWTCPVVHCTVVHPLLPAILRLRQIWGVGLGLYDVIMEHASSLSWFQKWSFVDLFTLCPDASPLMGRKAPQNTHRQLGPYLLSKPPPHFLTPGDTRSMLSKYSLNIFTVTITSWPYTKINTLSRHEITQSSRIRCLLLLKVATVLGCTGA